MTIIKIAQTHVVRALGGLILSLAIGSCVNEPDSSEEENQYGEGNGALTFYISQNLGGAVTVQVDGQPQGSLSSYYPNGAPDCGATATVTVSLPGNPHSWEAENSFYHWSGTTTVAESECEKIHLYINPNGYSPPGPIDGRPCVEQGTIIVRSPTIQIGVWDHGQIDGDIVSLALNSDWVIENRQLTAVPISVNVNIRPVGPSFLILWAHNEGSIPPNTPAIRISDGYSQQDFYQLNSTLTSNGYLRLIVEPQ